MEDKRITFRIDYDIYSLLRGIAEDNYMSVSAYIRKLIIEDIKSQ